MKLIALLCWYDATAPSWLAATASSLARIGVDHLVAVDGAFPHLPDSRPRSGCEQADALVQTCDAIDIGLTIHRQRDFWYDGEPAKRTHLFRLATVDAEVGVDWMFVIDDDEVVVQGSKSIRRELEEAPSHYHVAMANIWQRSNFDKDGRLLEVAQKFESAEIEHTFQQPRFYRVMEDMAAEVTHYHFAGTLDGVRYQLRSRDDEIAAKLGYEPAARFAPERPVTLEHRNNFRPKARLARKEELYRSRHELGLEAWPGS